jgi:hypothetical protein
MLDVEGQGGRNNVRFFREVNGGAVHPLGCAGLISDGRCTLSAILAAAWLKDQGSEGRSTA